MMRLFAIVAALVLSACAGSSAYAPTGKIDVLWPGRRRFA